jgi:hypothetical protein
VTGRPYFVFRVGHSDVRKERLVHKYLHRSQSLLVVLVIKCVINTLNAELNPICHLLALLGAHHILHVGRIRVKLDVSGSVHHSTIPYRKSQQDATVYQILIFLILNKAQHVSGDIPPIIRNLKLLVQF